MDFNLEELMIRVPVILLALTLHEFAHAYAAYRLGDPTAYRLGRCTLNPIKHLDPLGTICLLFAPIGWAKPVPVNPGNFRDPRMGDVITSIVGPLSNLAQAVVFALLIRGTIFYLTSRTAPLSEQGELFVNTALYMLVLGVIINVGLTIFNLLPIHPLDGFHVAIHLSGQQMRRRLEDMRYMGPFLILGLVLVSSWGDIDILSKIIFPPTNYIFRYVAGIELGDLLE